MSKVIDSAGWIEYFIDGSLADEYAKHLEGTERIVTPAVVVYEIYKKLLRDLDERTATEAVAFMLKSSVAAVDAGLAVAAAETSLQHKLPMGDAMIYATAQAEGATVITSDEHFKGLPGVEFIERV